MFRGIEDITGENAWVSECPFEHTGQIERISSFHEASKVHYPQRYMSGTP